MLRGLGCQPSPAARCREACPFQHDADRVRVGARVQEVADAGAHRLQYGFRGGGSRQDDADLGVLKVNHRGEFQRTVDGNTGAKDQDLGRFAHHLAEDVPGAVRKVVALEHLQ